MLAGLMLRLALLLASAVRSAFRSRADLTIENLALRQQLAVFASSCRRRQITAVDRLFWVALRKLWFRWSEVLLFVKRSPWQNGVAERWIGSVRRELLDHVVVFNERQLRRLLTEYVAYYHDDRTHAALEKGTPAGRLPVGCHRAGAAILARPRLGGLHHRYDWAA